MNFKKSFFGVLLTGALLTGFAGQAAADCEVSNLAISKVCYQTAGGTDKPYVEIFNGGDSSEDLSSVELLVADSSTGEDKRASVSVLLGSTIHETIPAGGRLVVFFTSESTESADTSFAGDGRAFFYKQITQDTLPQLGCAYLFRSPADHSAGSVMSFVAWGSAPGNAAREAVKAGLWPSLIHFVPTKAEDAPLGPAPFLVYTAGCAIVNFPATGEWAVVAPGMVTPGYPNPSLVANALPISPSGSNEEKPSDNEFHFVWSMVPGVSEYVVTVATGEDMSGVLFSNVFTGNNTNIYLDLTPGSTYYWSVKPNVEGATAFKTSFTVVPNIDALLAPEPASGSFEKVSAVLYSFHYVKNGSAGLDPFGAWKETRLLAVPTSKDKQTLLAYSQLGTEWDQPQTHKKDLTSWWCWAVSARMINHYYGGDITNDEVVMSVKNKAFYIGQDSGASNGDLETAYKFAMGVGTNYSVITAKPGAGDIKGWIDANEPLYFGFFWYTTDGAGNGQLHGGHIVTIRAYAEIAGKFYVNCVNWDNDAATKWILWDDIKTFANYTATPNSSGEVFNRILLPTGAITTAKTNDEISKDDDSDGVMNYDESVRWPTFFGSDNTLNPVIADTDEDGIPDKVEIESWVFGPASARALAGFPDIDHDGLYPECDEDTDGGGLDDGKEDLDHNGVVNGEEGNVYDPRDDGVLDLVFLIDTTGSMGGEIANAKANAITILDNVATKFADFRVALIDYRDFAERTGSYGDYPYNVDQTFTDDVPGMTAAINSLSLGDGGDFPETCYSAIAAALDGEVGRWRQQAKRAIIIMTDATPLDPEPYTGYTYSSILAKLIAGGVTSTSVPVSGTFEKLEGEISTGSSASGLVMAYTIEIGGYAGGSYDSLASGTGGHVFNISSSSEVTAAILEAVGSMADAPVVNLDVSGGVAGSTVVKADASRSWDPNGCGIKLYEWDWNGDGVFDETTYTGVAEHSYESGFGGKLLVRVTTLSGTKGSASFTAAEVPVFINVTDQLETLTWGAWTLDHDTGFIDGTVTLTAKSSAAKHMTEPFWLAVTPTSTVSLADPDGKTSDEIDYIDISDKVKAALADVGNKDAKLDAGESVTISGLPFFSTNRVAPSALVYALWADPPVSDPNADDLRGTSIYDGNNIYDLSWLGTYWAPYYPWVYAYTAGGWMYVSADKEGGWFWSVNHGWIYASPFLNKWIYSADLGWLYIMPGKTGIIWAWSDSTKSYIRFD